MYRDVNSSDAVISACLSYGKSILIIIIIIIEIFKVA